MRKDQWSEKAMPGRRRARRRLRKERRLRRKEARAFADQRGAEVADGRWAGRGSVEQVERRRVARGGARSRVVAEHLERDHATGLAALARALRESCSRPQRGAGHFLGVDGHDEADRQAFLAEHAGELRPARRSWRHVCAGRAGTSQCAPMTMNELPGGEIPTLLMRPVKLGTFRPSRRDAERSRDAAKTRSGLRLRQPATCRRNLVMALLLLGTGERRRTGMGRARHGDSRTRTPRRRGPPASRKTRREIVLVEGGFCASAIRSTSSMPTDRRTSPSSMPSLGRSSGGSDACVMIAGCSIRLSTPPSVSAR